MTNAYLKHIRAHIPYAQAEGIDLSVAISGSEGVDSQFPSQKRGFAYIDVPNRPLGNKFNEAVRLALSFYNPDYIMIMGSDTFMSPSIWKVYAKYIAEGETYIGTTDLYMWDWRDNRAVYWAGYNGDRAMEPIGPGRVIHKSLIPWDGGIYDKDLNRNLDASFTRRMLTKGIKATTFKSKDHLLVSCKGDENITDISLFNQHELVDVDHTIFKEVMNL